MMKWIARLVHSAPQLEKLVSDDLRRLNDVKPGLGDQAAAYVCEGEHETVLSTLARLTPSQELEICASYVQANSPALARRRVLARAHPYPFAQAQRYAEVLAAAAGSAIDDAPGTGAVPKVARVFFAEAVSGLLESNNTWPPTPIKLEGKGLVLEAALEMLRRLGAGAVDFVDLLYARGQTHSSISGDIYRQVIDLHSYIFANADAAIAAARRIPAAGRAELIRNLVEWGLSRDQPFIEFLVEQAGDGAKAPREAASSALADAPAQALEPLAIDVLAKGDVDQRAGMVELLARLRTPTALDALREHREGERTARISAAIDNALAIAEQMDAPRTGEDGPTGYTAIDGRRVEVPPLRPLADSPVPTFGETDRAVLRAAIAEANEKARKQNEENAKRGVKWEMPIYQEAIAEAAVALLNADLRTSRASVRDLEGFLHHGAGANWLRGALAKLPDQRALPVAALHCGSARSGLSPWMGGPAVERLRDFLSGPNGDLRHLEAIDIAAGREVRQSETQRTRPLQPGDYLRIAMQAGYSHQQASLYDLPKQAVWPYLAENLEAFDQGFGLLPESDFTLDRAQAIRMLALLPAAPARYFAPLLEAATSTTKAGRAEARAMLGPRPEVAHRLVALLDDSRQAVRVGAAEWLAERKDPLAAKALWARLEKEESEPARAAILTGLKGLGEDLSQVLGPEALIAEAEKGLKGTKLDKLDWLALDALPRLRFKVGATVPREVPQWWIALAYKLKQPGNALFSIYLEQLEPEDARALSTWILDGWVSYDTARRSETEANAYAKQNMSGRFQQMVRWITDYTEERAFADLKREFLGQYPNSGADSKGLLALAVRAPSALAADRVRSYLKNHGSRTSQASSLLEMLAAVGDPVALQVVISAATRLKQKGVQKLAGELVAKVAEARDWSLDELADRTIPTAGFDDEGTLTLPCGEDARDYEAHLTSELSVVLRNPAGKEVASLPAGNDEATAAARKQLSTTKKELKQIASMQSARLYEALCAERAWSADDWLRNFHQHPVMRKLVERIVWLGLDDKGAIAGSFRPTAEGDFTNERDEPVDVTQLASVRPAHGALVDEATAKAWEQHLRDYEVKPLFTQFGRSLLKIDLKDATKTEIDDRKGWVTDAFTVRGAASKLGYERGPALDGGFFNEYRKTFQGAGLAAVIEFTGNSLPEENRAAAILALRFEKASGPGLFAGAARLGDVPPVLLSECWNDYRAFAAKGTYDADWEKNSSW